MAKGGGARMRDLVEKWRLMSCNRKVAGRTDCIVRRAAGREEGIMEWRCVYYKFQ